MSTGVYERLEAVLGWEGACECGKRHAVGVRRVVYGEDAVEQLAAWLRRELDGERLTVIADERTWEVAGHETARACAKAGWAVRETIVRDDERGSPVCDDVTLAILEIEAPHADVYVAVGSGVINDLTKWLAFRRGRPYGVFATAASMNGYAAANVAPMIRGVKVLERAAAPLIVAARPSVLAHAPWELTAAGFGDVLAKALSVADWRMNALLVGEQYCARCAELINELEPLYCEHPEALRAGDPAALRGLFYALVFSGVAMTMMGSSVPASGGEHLFSHTLDMLATLRHQQHDLHGRQVGIGSIIAAELHRQVWALDEVEPRLTEGDADASVWGAAAPVISDQWRAKTAGLQKITEVMRDKMAWGRVRAALRESVPSAENVRDILRRAGAAWRLRDIGIERVRAREALLHMHEIRARTTIVDVAWLAGVLPGTLEELLSLLA